MSYTLKNRVALVTGGGSGISHALARLLLQAGCSVMIGDLQLRPEAEATLQGNPHPASDAEKPSALFRKTNVSDWAQLKALWNTALEKFGRVDIVVNGAGIYEPPTSTFWNPPGISPLSEDAEDAPIGQYQSFAVNTVAPIRLAQIAIDYWQQNPGIQGNILFLASMGGYMHSIQTPLYFSSKAATVSFVKCLGPLRKTLGIRIAAVCPGPVFTPIFEAEYCRDRLRPGDVALSAEQCAAFMLQVLQEEQYGDGNIMEIMMVGSKEDQSVHVREVSMESLYPTVGPLDMGTRAMAETAKFVQNLKENGMRPAAN